MSPHSQDHCSNSLCTLTFAHSGPCFVLNDDELKAQELRAAQALRTELIEHGLLPDPNQAFEMRVGNTVNYRADVIARSYVAALQVLVDEAESQAVRADYWKAENERNERRIARLTRALNWFVEQRDVSPIEREVIIHASVGPL